MEPVLWIRDPSRAYAMWQNSGATGKDRRPFAARSVTQHMAMFERFVRFLVGREVTLATFGEDHLAAFFEELAGRCAPGTNTRQRYANLIDRLCRELVRVGLRESNPAENLAHWQA
jgi:integrase/recombinase XerD